MIIFFKLLVTTSLVFQLTKCKVIKHRLIFTNVSDRHPKMLTILGLLDGLHLSENVHIEAGKQEIFDRQKNILSLAFDTRSSEISVHGIQPKIHSSSQLREWTTSNNHPRSDKKTKILNYRRTRRAISSLSNIFNKSRSTNSGTVDNEIGETFTNKSIVSEQEEITEMQPTQQSPEQFLESPNSINHSTNLSNTGKGEPASTIQNDTAYSGYIYLKPNTHNGTPIFEAENILKSTKPTIIIPPLSDGVPIAELSLPFTHQAPLFNPSVATCPNDLSAKSSLTTYYYFPKHFSGSTTSQFKPSLIDFQRDYLEGYDKYKNSHHTSFKPNLPFMLFTHWLKY